VGADGRGEEGAEGFLLLGREAFQERVQRFRGGLESEAHRLLYRSTLGLRVITKKNLVGADGRGEEDSEGLLLFGRHGGPTFVCTSLVRHDGSLRECLN